MEIPLLIIAAYIVFVRISMLLCRWLIKRVRRFLDHRAGLFVDDVIEVRTFYVRRFRRIPVLSFIDGLDATKVFDQLSRWNKSRIEVLHQSNRYNWKSKRHEFTKTIFSLGNRIVIELGDDWVEILSDGTHAKHLEALIEVLVGCKAEKQIDEFNIHIISSTSDGLLLKQLDIHPTTLDIGLYYNDDFAAVDQLIRQRLMQPNDKGIVLLHGLPGTGKTTYLRHLIGSLQKKVLFVAPEVAADLAGPAFIDLLIDNPNSVLVIEDAEKLILDRKYNSNSSVSNLLNISDGLLSDCLNVQIICTFNNALSMVDSALLRKGRLIAKYEFGKLETAKARALNDALGLGAVINKPMTLAEIMNPGEPGQEIPTVQVIGFRRNAVLEN
jgi:hypothetical protein